MESTGKNWWESGSIRITTNIENLWELGKLKIDDIARITDIYADTCNNAVHVSVMKLGEGCGTDTDGFLFKSSVEPNENIDLLEAYISEFHKRNIRVIIYFNGHSFIPETYKKYPGWVMINESGEPVFTIYNTGMSACPNNNSFREWQAGVIRDLCRYEIDGVFLDGDIFFAATCYCDTCKRLFMEKYGVEMPKKSQHKHPEWKNLRQFQIDSLTSYVDYLYKVLKECRPEALLYCNSGLRAANWTTGRQNRRLIEVQDLLLSEGGFLYGNFNLTPIWRTECEDKLCMTQSKGKPVISGMAAGHKPWNYYNLPVTEMRLMMYSAIATGAHSYTGFSSSDNNYNEHFAAVNSVHKFIKENENIIYPAESLAKVALVWSNVNADFYSGSEVKKTDFTEENKGSDIGSAHLEFEGFYDMCFRNHIPVDVIDEFSLTDGTINKYDVIILPNIACMSDAEIESIKGFVKNGGTLVSTFETSMYDETGGQRSEFGLKEVTGVVSHDGLIGPSLFNYVMAVENENPEISSLSEYKHIPSPKYGLKVKSLTAGKAMDFAKLLKGRYDGIPDRSSDGFLFTNRYGRGKSIYFAGTIGQAAIEWHFREYFNMMNEILTSESKPPVIVDKAPESVSLNVMRNKNSGEILIYLTNFTGAMSRPVNEVCPVYSIKVRLNFKASEIRSLYSENNIKLQEEGDKSLITISELNEFEAILVIP